MTVQTPAILLRREFINVYDEKLTLFTEKMGKVLLYSYGSRSIKSNRRALLSHLQWLEINLTKHKQFYTLRAVRSIKAIVLPQVYAEILLLQELLKYCSFIIPFETRDNLLYWILNTLTEDKMLQLHGMFKALLYPTSLLKFLGELPSATQCQLCHTVCSATYVPTHEGIFIGTKCLRHSAAAQTIT